jgi:hypothetical protein
MLSLKVYGSLVIRISTGPGGLSKITNSSLFKKPIHSWYGSWYRVVSKEYAERNDVEENHAW